MSDKSEADQVPVLSVTATEKSTAGTGANATQFIPLNDGTVKYLGGCNCAFKAPTPPTCRDPMQHLDGCPAKNSGYPVGGILLAGRIFPSEDGLTPEAAECLIEMAAKHPECPLPIGALSALQAIVNAGNRQ